MADEKKFILGFGEVMLRLAPAANLRLAQVLPGQLEATFGGGEANVCASLAMLGENARYLTAIPENPISTAFLREIRGLGVDVSKVLMTKSGRFSVYYVEKGANQRASNVIYDREFSAVAMSAPEDYDWDSSLENCKWIHLSGITPALSEKAFRSTLAAAKFASEKNVSVSCDLNFRKKLWQWHPSKKGGELACECMTQILEYVDLIIGNEEDAKDVFGIKAGSSSVENGLLDRSSYTEVAASLSCKFPKASYIATTLRESLSASCNKWGAMLYDVKAGKSFFAPYDSEGKYSPYMISDIVDRVGGGDSFSAGLLFALNHPDLKKPQDAVAFAAAASCLKHSIMGDYNHVSFSEVINLMRGNASGRVQR